MPFGSRYRIVDFVLWDMTWSTPGEEPAYLRDVGTLDAYYEANMDRLGARVRRAISDRYNVIQPGERIGYDAGSDRARGGRTESGIVAIPGAPVRGDTNIYE